MRPAGADRPAGLSVRLKLTLSYAGFLVVAGVVMLGAVWLFLLRYVPDRAMLISADDRTDGVFPIRSGLLRVFAPRAAGALALLAVVGLVGGWWLAGRMLAPLGRITDATRRAASGSLSHRIGLAGRHDEFRELADAFDGMLAQLEAKVAEQQRFAANASHELRTPLAISRSLLDVARQDPQRDTEALIERLHAVTGRAIDLTESLLLLSRVDQRAFEGEPVDLSLVAEEAAETLLPLAERRGVTVEVSGEAAVAAGSRPLLLQVVTNLVHNGIVHNVGDGGIVRVCTRAGPPGRGVAAVVTVENSGEPLTAEAVATLAEPFQRGGQRARSDHGGVGLGLAIVDSITRAHDGALVLTPRPGGGLVAEVRLPAVVGAVR